MKKLQKIAKLALVAVLSTFILSTATAIIPQAFATPNPGLENMQFHVTKYLRLPSTTTTNPADETVTTENQDQAYFFGTGDQGGDPTATTPFPIVAFLLNVINLLTKVAGTIAVLMLIITGFIMMFSQGSQNMIEKAKSMFGYEILGIIVIFLSYVLVVLVQGIFTI